MEKAASASLKQCLRSGKTLRCRIANPSSSAGCIATAICPARIAAHTSPTNPSSASRVRDHVRLSMPKRTLRGYSTQESSIAGTIGKGTAGIPSEAEHTFEALVAPEHLNEKERAVWELLSQELKPQRLEVQDISGGCGSMYGIEIVSERFRGLGMLKQQRLVNEILGDMIKEWHGVQLKTRVP